MDAFGNLEHFQRQLLLLAATVRFNKHNSVDVYRMALYGSLLEFADAMCILYRAKRYTALDSIFRSFLEGAVDLRNLLRDASYVENMNVAHAKQWLKVLREAKGGHNPSLSGIAGAPDLDAKISEHEAEIQRLGTQGYRALNVCERFDRAGMLEEYGSLYNFLSCDAHSNIRALVSRHMHQSEDGYDIQYYKAEPAESFIPMADSSAGLLLQASRDLHEVYKSQKISEVDSMLQALEQARAAYVT